MIRPTETLPQYPVLCSVLMVVPTMLPTITEYLPEVINLMCGPRTCPVLCIQHVTPLLLIPRVPVQLVSQHKIPVKCHIKWDITVQPVLVAELTSELRPT